jgi:hypothetical protein
MTICLDSESNPLSTGSALFTDVVIYFILTVKPLKIGRRSRVQGSTFRVKVKEGVEDPKSFLQMFIFPSNCQLGLKYWIRPDETDAFLVNTHPKCSPGTRMEP